MDDNLNTKANSDIQDALRQFEMQSETPPMQAENTQNEAVATPPKQQIAGISFETDSYAGFKYVKQTDTPKIVDFVMKHSGGLIKEERHAYYVVFALVVFIFLFSAFLFFKDSIHIPPPQPTPEERLQMEQLNYQMTQRPSK